MATAHAALRAVDMARVTRADPMASKPKPKPDNPNQFRRFIETAREIEADESPGALDRAVGRLNLKSEPVKKTTPSNGSTGA